MKTLNSVLQKYEQDSQRVISSLEKSKLDNARKLVEEYIEFSYETILDNTTKAQVAFGRSANHLLEIENRELKQLDDFKIIKETLIKEKEDLEEKIVILDAITIKEQQYKLDFQNLQDESKSKIEKLLEEQSNIREEWNRQLLDLDKRINEWEKQREKDLSKEAEERLYQHNLEISQIKDDHVEKLEELRREQELKSRSIEKDIASKKREIEDNSKKFEEAKEYLERYDENVSAKVAKLVRINMGAIKDEHKNRLESEERNLSNQLEILDIKIDTTTKSVEDSKEVIEELKEKLEIAKAELNQLIQNTLSLKE